MLPDINDILKQYWGFDHFRPLQEDIIHSVLGNHDTLTLLPTGGGKSLCYQIPALCKPGLCIVVSPLIALIKDQLDNLKQKGIYAEGVFSGMSHREVDLALDNCINGPIKFLYLSPERLRNDLFLTRLKKMPVNLLAIDEAHCISQWGYDFRPPYLQIAEFRENLPNVPLIALTATATTQVKQDIIHKLAMQAPHVFEGSYRRSKLSYSALFEEDKVNRIIQLTNAVKGSGLIYVNRRRRAEELYKYLYDKGLSVSYYHAGLTADLRESVRKNWMENQIRFIVSTNAFGMGVDKPDVRLVIHADIPSSPESYFQEAGRAGRDDLKAYAVLLYNKQDVFKLEQGFNQKFPVIEKIKEIYTAICKYLGIAYGEGAEQTFDFVPDQFIKKHPFSLPETSAALHWLQNAGYITANDGVYRNATIRVLFNHTQLKQFENTHPSESELLKMILRSSPGIMDHYVGLNEYNISASLKVGKGLIIEQLNKLHNYGVLDYVQASASPQITFNFPRPQNDALYIDKVFYETQKKQALVRLNWITNYAQQTETCRQLLLRQYFSESTVDKCGICDVCTGRYVEQLGRDEKQLIMSAIKEAVIGNRIKLEQLEKYIIHWPKHKWQPVLKYMLDERLIIIQKDFTLNSVS